MQQAVESA